MIEKEKIPLVLDWRKVASNIKWKLLSKINEIWSQSYVSIIFIWENSWSSTYVKLKKRFWKSIWLNVEVFWQWIESKIDYLDEWKQKKLDNLGNISLLIDFLNNDDNCLWIMVQLPLPEKLQKFQNDILTQIVPRKDFDWLWWTILWLSSMWLIDFMPATIKSVFSILDFYWLWNLSWKTVSVLWQWNLVWKPVLFELLKRNATVYSTNHLNSQENIIEMTKKSDYIIAWTWKLHLVDKKYLSCNKKQILLDIWFWYLNWKPVWDINISEVKDCVFAYTPIPWWIWPVTVASLFENIFLLLEQKQIIKKYFVL